MPFARMKVRAYTSRDAASLTAVSRQTPARFNRAMTQVRRIGGRIWVVVDEQDTAVGYAALLPVPGLPHLAELQGEIVPDRRGMGYGRLLLSYVRQQAAGAPYRQLSVKVPNLDDAAARFLLAQGFFLEHEEWVMHQQPLTVNQEPIAPEATVWTIADQATAVATFLTLYDQSFAPHPWYQPYTASEVQATLANPADILFLQSPISPHQSPIGFAWLHRHGPVGEIEPMGIVPAWQGKGYGRSLLRAALQNLAQQGTTSAQITAWRSNHAAIHLYQNSGFQHTHTHTYLAYNLRAA